MSCSRRHVINALAPLRREQRLRHPATMALFAGATASPWAQASGSCWKFNARRPAKGFQRSYALKRRKIVRKVRIDQPMNTQESASPEAEITPPWRAAKGSLMETLDRMGLLLDRTEFLPPRGTREGLDLRGISDLSDLTELHPPRVGPEVRFDQSDPNFNPETRHAQGSFALEGYTSDAENIKIYFRPLRVSSWRDPVELSKLYLRDICQCSKCVSPSTGRKTFATCDIPAVPRLRDPSTESIRLSADGGLEITWEDDFLTGDAHTSVYSQDFLRRLASYDGKTYHYTRPKRVLWDNAKFRHDVESRVITYRDWMEGGLEFAQALVDLDQHGLLFMRGVPKSRHSVQMVAEKIGSLQSTYRGLTWDTISQPGEKHVADANQGVRLHQDLLYYSDPPRVKFLHCLENECQGGVSLFSDGLHVALELNQKDPLAFRTLGDQLVTYWYQRAGRYYVRRRHVIESRPDGEPQSISWSPAFQGPFRIREHRKPLGPDSRPRLFDVRTQQDAELGNGALRVWCTAARAFKDILESPENLLEYRLQPGDCVIFDNMRILHGRTEVDASAGLRHLRGAYVDAQTMYGAFVSVNEKGLLRRKKSSSPLSSLSP